jgi:hypothetical protein
MYKQGLVKKLAEKWGPVVEGIESDEIKQNVAFLCENTARELTVNEDTTDVGKLSTWQKWAFPLIRRVIPELLANKIVGVQPIDGPVSQIFYIGHERSKNGGTPETIYSKYNITYGGKEASALPNLTGISNLGSSTQASAVSGAAGNSTSLLDTIGKQIAAFPTSSTLTQHNTSAGEYLTGTSIPEISFRIQQQPVVARTRKFRTLWTIEAQQDLKAYHNLELEREVTELMSDEVQLEIDRELIEDLRMLAYDVSSSFGAFSRTALDLDNSNSFPTEHDWTPSSYEYSIAAESEAFKLTNVYFFDHAANYANTAPRHVGELYANLLAAVNFAAYDIHKTTYRGPGDFIVTSPVIAAMLESAAKLEGGLKESDMSLSKDGIQHKGSLGGRYDLYVDPLYPEGEILVGRKGKNPTDSGYVYAPYIPIMPLDTVINPDDFQPRKGLLTRYAKAAITPSSRHYRVIRLVSDSASNQFLYPFARSN